MKLLVAATLGLAALVLVPAHADACSPAPTCASQLCRSADALVEGTIARFGNEENGQFLVTLENAETAGDIEPSELVVVRAYTYQFSADEVGTTALIYVTREVGTGELLVTERITRGALAELDCFDTNVSVSELAEVVLAEDCFQTLPHDISGCENRPIGCSAGGAHGSLALFVVGLALWRRRRR